MTDLTQNFRLGMRRIGAAVNLITATDSEGRFMGMAATAVSSLSADPPSLLVCVNRSASIHQTMVDTDHFAVNVLHQEQMEIVAAFSSSDARSSRFEQGAWTKDANGVPYLGEAQASFSCLCDKRVEYGTHTIFIGAVLDVRVREQIDPLLYLNGKFCRAVA
jgi:flavin reductase (DIM6/NTAB) family NADH-FMN oxidoreductase RutF